jgi:hypothetical protein
MKSGKDSAFSSLRCACSAANADYKDYKDYKDFPIAATAVVMT